MFRPILAFWLFFFATHTLVWAQPKVKSLDFKDFSLDEDSDEGKMKMLKREYKEYDAQGRLTKSVNYATSPSGKAVKVDESIKVYQADVRSDENSTYDEEGELKTWEKISYNAENKKIKHEFGHPDLGPNQRYTRIYVYTEFNKPLSVSLTDPKGEKAGEEKWKYNKQDEEIFYEKWELDPKEGRIEESRKIEYNKDGTFAKSEKIIKKGSDVYKELVTFENNRVKEQLKYKNDQVVSQFGGEKKKNFDASKATVMMSFGNDEGDDLMFGGGAWETQDEFDAKGNKIKTTQTVDGLITEVKTYEYDSRGNLIKVVKTAYEDNEPSTSEEEVLEYDAKNNLKRKATYTNGFLMSEKTYDYQYH